MLQIVLAQSHAQETAGASKFVRFIDDQAGGGRLEVSTVRYRNSQGVTIDLIGAVHVADAAFYHALNQRFDQYDALLFEMVKPRGMDLPPRGAPSGHWVGASQRLMTVLLGLSYQLDLIDYDRPNFVHADMNAEEMALRMAERGESVMSLMLRGMLWEMTRPRGPGDAAAPAMGPEQLQEFLLALQTPDRPRRLKLMLAPQFSQMDLMLAAMEGEDGSVLIGERNRKALEVAGEQIRRGKRRIGLFYGAAHLGGMETILIDEMGFRPVGAPQWLTAWDMTAPSKPSSVAP